MTVAVTNALDVVCSTINGILRTNDLWQCFWRHAISCRLIVNWVVSMSAKKCQKYCCDHASEMNLSFHLTSASSSDFCPFFNPHSWKSSRRRVVFYFFPESDVVGGSWKPNVENQLFWLRGAPSKMCPPDFQIELFLKTFDPNFPPSWKWEKQ